MKLSWFFGDERLVERDALLDQVAESGATVPGLWWLEVANALLVAFRQERLSASFRDQAIQRLRRLPISVDADARAWTNTLPPAVGAGLSIYGAS